MTEEAGRTFGQMPILVVRPECGEFVTRKARANANPGVMARDGVATDHPQEMAAEAGKPGAARFESDEEARGSRCQGQHFFKLRRLKMMKEQVAKNGVSRIRRQLPEPFRGRGDFQAQAPIEMIEAVADGGIK